jgi:dTDP-4-dehydrorhamnose reductase
MLRLNETRDEVGVVADQLGNPTSALDIADALIAIAGRVKDDPPGTLRGIFNMTGPGGDLGRFRRSGIPGGGSARPAGAPGQADRDRHYPTPAERPANSCPRQ